MARAAWGAVRVPVNESGATRTRTGPVCRSGHRHLPGGSRHRFGCRQVPDEADHDVELREEEHVDRALQPGMRLMRKISITGKFVVVTLLLLLPSVSGDDRRGVLVGAGLD